jgi:branched-subunit amino acid transport protein
MLKRAFISVLLMALVTYLPRVLPIAVFRKKIKSAFIQSFLHYIPFAVLAALTFPDIFYSTGSFSTALCGTLVALLLAYQGQGLVVVALAAIVTVFLSGLFF